MNSLFLDDLQWPSAVRGNANFDDSANSSTTQKVNSTRDADEDDSSLLVSDFSPRESERETTNSDGNSEPSTAEKVSRPRDDDDDDDDDYQATSRPKKRGRKPKESKELHPDMVLAWKLAREDMSNGAPPTTRSSNRRSSRSKPPVVEEKVEPAKRVGRPPKKRVGRPPKRGVGRPPKNSSESVTKSKSSSKKDMKCIVKRRVGRPPKNPKKHYAKPASATAKKHPHQQQLVDETTAFRVETAEPAHSSETCQAVEPVAVVVEPKVEPETEYDGECARTRLYRRMEEKAKGKKYQFSFPQNIGKKVDNRGTLSARDKRHQSRHYRKLLERSNINSDAVKENELKNRNRSVYVSKSNIHGLGLFAAEDIDGGQFVLEYVAVKVRHVVADIREKRYKEIGIGDSYLFSLDRDFVLDATHRGSMGRFINHSCNPNVTARISVYGNEKRIVFYSKKKIMKGQEITYDYCFGAEEEEKKVACLCKLANCRKFLN